MANCADELRALASKVGQVAYGVHEYFGNGLLEKVYETALEHRLIKEGYKVERQKPLKIREKRSRLSTETKTRFQKTRTGPSTKPE